MTLEELNTKYLFLRKLQVGRWRFIVNINPDYLNRPMKPH